MGKPAAILAGAIIIGAAILFSAHWSLVVGPTVGTVPTGEYPREGIYRLDRWTGSVAWCGTTGLPTPNEAAPVNCEVK
jgi:hypothetical protein